MKFTAGRALGLVFLLFALPALFFAIYTDNRWEDFYITFRSSKNLVLGHGLVFTEGERLHAFTSPLGVLLPALCSLLTGINHDDAALWLFRLMCIAALGFAGVLIYLVLQKRGVSPLVTWTTLALAALDAKTVMFTVNGMETALVILALSLSIYALTVESRRMVVFLGVAWGGVMWVRPDGFIYAGAIALFVLIFQAGLASERGRVWLLRQYAYAVGLAAAIYLPWFVWAWIYYGTPIPHTIIAKGLHQYAEEGLLDVGYYLDRADSFEDIFGPTNVRFGGWNPAIVVWSCLLWILSAAPLILPGVARLTRALAAAFLLVSFYLCFIAANLCSWYAPNCAWIGFLVIGLAAHDFTRDPKTSAGGGILSGLKLPRTCLGIAGVAILMQLIVVGCVFQQTYFQQKLIEFGQRKQIGLWLKQHAVSSHDTVFVECLGYIGYYSNLKMYDFPGLSSEEIIQSRKRQNTDIWAYLIKDLHPDWLVLRPVAIQTINIVDASILSTDYQEVQDFDCSKEIAPLSIQGRGYLEFDQYFVVYHRKH